MISRADQAVIDELINCTEVTGPRHIFASQEIEVPSRCIEYLEMRKCVVTAADDERGLLRFYIVERL